MRKAGHLCFFLHLYIYQVLPNISLAQYLIGKRSEKVSLALLIRSFSVSMDKNSSKLD